MQSFPCMRMEGGLLPARRVPMSRLAEMMTIGRMSGFPNGDIPEAARPKMELEFGRVPASDLDFI